MKVGDIVYHPQFRREGQYNGTGVIREIVETGFWDNIDVLVVWGDGAEEWYIQDELRLEKNL